MVLLAALSASLATSTSAQTPSRIYVGTYTGTGPNDSQGIYVLDFDDATGKLGQPRLAGETTNPSFLTLDMEHGRLFSVAEVRDQGGRRGASLIAWKMNTDGTLEEIGRAETGGDGPCFVGLSPQADLAGVANYGGGSVALFQIGPMGLPTRTDFVQHAGKSVNTARQEGPHAHSFQFARDGELAIAADLGTDELVVYDVVDGRQLERNETLTCKLPPGHGPRHFALSPDGRFVLVIEELASKITVLRIADDGLEMIGDYSTLPDDFNGENTTAEIQFHPNGQFVYGSNRGHDSLAIFAFDSASGRLTAQGHVSTGGQTPRNFRPSPDGKWLLAANQQSDNIVVFRLSEDGSLQPTGQSVSIPKPVCLKFTR